MDHPAVAAPRLTIHRERRVRRAGFGVLGVLGGWFGRARYSNDARLWLAFSMMRTSLSRLLAWMRRP